MKKRIFVGVLTLSLALQCFGAVRYVNVNSATPAAPYTNWSSASRSIQQAIDASSAGDLILVTNGIYNTSGRTFKGANRIALTRPVTVQSVNGPAFTTIAGLKVPGTTNGPSAIRCAYVTNGAMLAGFTLTNGATHISGAFEETYGGGVYCESVEALVSNCVIIANSAYFNGGGAYGGTLKNCTLTQNSASSGGGASQASLYNCAVVANNAAGGGGASGSRLINCTVTGNSAQFGGGVGGCSLNNSIVYYNVGGNYDSDFGGALNHCVTTPLPGGAGNLDVEPQLASASHLNANSPCIGRGDYPWATGVDIDGEPWVNPPSIGCDEFRGESLSGPLTVAISASQTNVVAGFDVDLRGLISGRVGASRWEFGDGTVLSNRPYAAHSWSANGDYQIVLRAFNDTYPAGVTATMTVHVIPPPVHYVALGNATPVAPYRSWATAATNIQDAVDVATMPGAQVLVTNGVYRTGGRELDGMNRLVVNKVLTVRSVNGPEVTVIEGNTNSFPAIRCVYLTKATAILSGFTLTRGGSQGGGSGGGASGGTLTNCTLLGNSARDGGGAYNSILERCTLAGNSAGNFGGGAYLCALKNCSLVGNNGFYGGAAQAGTLESCTIISNSAWVIGGGAFGSTLNNCVLTGNSANQGGGAYNSTLKSCTLTGNSATESGGGVYVGTLTNCIVYYNKAPTAANSVGCYFDHSCTTPLPDTGFGNFSAEPQLASGTYLSANSPCIRRGTYAVVSGVDIDGESWANPPSIGCDEFHGESLTGLLTVSALASYTNVLAGFSVDFEGLIAGHVRASRWEFGDGTVLSNRLYASHAWSTIGDYQVILRAYNDTYPGGLTATVTVHVVTQPVHYVNAANAAPSAPYTSWATAATTIQDAVDAALVPNALVLVTNGVYRAGGRPIYGMTNRVAVDRLLTLRSINGPQFTIIAGQQVPRDQSGPSGPNAIRCVYLASGATLSGFTLTNGATHSGGYEVREATGGGVWCESSDALVSNCVMTGNAAQYGGASYGGTLDNCSFTGNSAFLGGASYGGTLNNCSLIGNLAAAGAGGAFGGTLNFCTLSSNSASWGGGASGATLNNCVLTGNLANDGGGAYDGTLNNCTLGGNSATNYGGGIALGTLNNCALVGNIATNGGGGGAYQATLNNCTLTGNSSVYGAGGVVSCGLTNCIVYYNTASITPRFGDHDDFSSFDHSCTTPLPTGVGNLDVEPQLANGFRLSAGSACVGRGSYAAVTGVDIDGESWGDPPSIGCDEYYTSSLTGAVTVAVSASYTNVAVGFSVEFQGFISGRVSASRWEFEDGTIVSNRPSAAHTWNAAGDYVVVLRAYNQSNPDGVSGTIVVHVVAAMHYVALDSAAPTPPYTSWATAATNIQDAIDAVALPGALVLVTNGVYKTGGRSVNDVSNRVVLSKPLSVRSVNGPQVTIIRGYQSSNDTAFRCAYLGNGATLGGFTLTNALVSTVDDIRVPFGGGVYCESTSAVITDCVIAGCSATDSGGGVYSGTLNNCTLAGNYAEYGGGVYLSTLNDSMLVGNSAYYSGGGAVASTLKNCTLTDNRANSGYGGGAAGGTLDGCTLTGNHAYQGGGTYGSTLRSCSLVGNSADEIGGGAIFCNLNNCTLTGNSAFTGGGGVDSCQLTNCIVYHNILLDNLSAMYANHSGSTLHYSCTTPVPSDGIGNLAAEPELASGSHLSAGSPCIGQGTYASVRGLDIDGQPWANPPSIGCDEVYGGSLTGAITVQMTISYTNVAVGFPVNFLGFISGRVSSSRWEFGDGTVVSNRPSPSHSFAAAGDYSVVLRAYNASNPAGVTATVLVHIVTEVHYVALDSVSPTPPYTSWQTAATNIQDAVDAASAIGALVLVTNGVYQSGGRAVSGTVTNRVAVDKLLSVRSVNGPLFTTIKGYQTPLQQGGPNGDGAIRCVYLTKGATLSGFTLTNGATPLTPLIAENAANFGGGIWCETTAVVSNCVICGNAAPFAGGGVYSGTLNDCLLTGNVAVVGGAASRSRLNNCTLSRNVGDFGGAAHICELNTCNLAGNCATNGGGGSWTGTLNNCTLTGNWTTNQGGGSFGDTLNNCVLSDNSATNSGGGAYGSILANCTLAGNSAASGGGFSGGSLHRCTITGNRAFQRGGGGADNATLTDCILSANSAGQSGGGVYGGNLTNCTLAGNSAEFGGGAFMIDYQAGTLMNCKVTGNSATWAGGTYGGFMSNCVITYNSAFWAGGTYYSTLANCTVTGNAAEFSGGAYYGTLNNCIVVSNTAVAGENYLYSALNYSCTSPLPTNGVGNINLDPFFVDYAAGDLRLQAASPCINSGLNAYAYDGLDLDGNARIAAGTVDIGAYEFQSPASALPYAWFYQYGLTPSASIDSIDSDGDGASNREEWIAGSVPNDPVSALRIVSISMNTLGLNITWQSVTNKTYFIERATNLGATNGFLRLQSDIPAQAGTTTFTDYDAVGPGPFFYRVGVQP